MKKIGIILALIVSIIVVGIVAVQSVGGGTECVQSPEGLISWWSGDGNAFDITGANHGTLENGATFGFGIVGQAFSFDGTNDYLSAPGTGIDDLQELTIDAWVRLSSMPAGKVMRFVTLKNEKAVLRYDGSGLDFYMNIGGTSYHLSEDGVLGIGEWHHVAGTYGDGEMILYLDGEKKRSRFVSGTVATGNGVELSSATETLNGLIDEVEIYNRALYPGEIEAIVECKPESTSCEADGEFCTVDHCDGLGACVYWKDYDCSDEVSCTVDTCNEAIDACVNTPNDNNCPADEWFDTINKQWVSTGQCTEKEQKEQEYRDYSCGVSGCEYSITNTQWVDTGATRNKADGTSCDDGLFCTINDVCTAGVCDGDVPANEIDDDNDGMTECEGDCNDADDTIYEGALELCDNKDNNCNTQIDETICGEETDADCDHVNDCTTDKCLGTVIPESVPTEKLNPNHHAEIDEDLIFETLIKGKKKDNEEIIDSEYTLEDTYGCTCSQILECKPGKDNGEIKHGCTKGIMDDWIAQKGWAKDCS